MTDTNIFLTYLCVINIITFVTYGIDKRRAENGSWRIPEKTLLGLAVIGGSLGALWGMRSFHHKTRKPVFYIGVRAILLIQVLVLLGLTLWLA